ncbi:two-component system OmpR family sensor kinase [Neorhizobium huautlense]|uniref:histidine kinase n=1 Tax=Neorhizobium huautlense TaxID=67774 RepID=A0ABT9PUU2_9HYPH|nr:ATP-binding protein [Neorhizobium huautlense]MDP9838231.1 two-component system OmpR family sensor kinase [Neorhizobium huautlense]
MNPFARASGPSMTRRLIFSITAMMALLWLLAVGLGLVVMEEEYAEMFDGTLQDTAERLVPLVVDDLEHRGMLAEPDDNRPGTAPQQLQTGNSSGDREYLIYQVRDASGRVLIRSHDAPEQAFETPLKAGFWKNTTYQFYTATDESAKVFIQVADAFENREEALREGAIALFLPLALLIPVSGIAIWLVVRRAVQPVGELRRQIETKDGGNMEPVDASILPRELQPIATSVNLLMTRLRTALDAEREFTSNSAHELRTPIAGALAQTQMLISELRDPANRHRAGQIEASLTRLSHLAEKLLQLSRAEAGIGIAEKSVDLSLVLDMVLTDFWRGMNEPQRLILNRTEGAKLTGPFSEDAFAIVLRNLIENALVHGRPGEPVEVFLENGGPVRIVNGADLMSEGELATIRKRFSRGKTEATGSGLGLSIVERLLGQMGGKLVLASPADGRKDRFEARVELPKTV